MRRRDFIAFAGGAAVFARPLAAGAQRQLDRILYVTHSAGFRHSSIEVSKNVLDAIAAESGQLQVTWTEDLAFLTAAQLSNFDAVFFFTSK